LIEEKSRPYVKMITVLCTIPGVKRKAAISILVQCANAAVKDVTTH
jgi:hypothetical protein